MARRAPRSEPPGPETLRSLAKGTYRSRASPCFDSKLVIAVALKHSAALFAQRGKVLLPELERMSVKFRLL
jgi:hypothetical protein